MKTLNSLISNIHTNLLGKSVNGKYIIIESDDWGSIRMPNKNVFNELLKTGIPVDKSAYCKFDALESNQDVENLLEVLSTVKNREGQNPVITTNFVSANPDFKRINESNFEKYSCESIVETYKKVYNSDKVLKLIGEGTQLELVKPQFHGRDHVNVPLWLELLKTNKDFRFAFDLGMWGLSKDVFPSMRKSIQATYDSTDLEYCKSSITEGLSLFESIFGFKSRSFIANNFTWAEELEATLFECGIRHIQGMKYQLIPVDTYGVRKVKRNFSGYSNNLGLTYGIRNCIFEPFKYGVAYSKTLNQIKNSFLFNKPAIINTHRVNFSSRMCSKSCSNNLISFRSLLNDIVKLWPEVKFMSSDRLFNLSK